MAGAIGGGGRDKAAGECCAERRPRVYVSCDVTRTHRATRSSSMLPINFTVPYHQLALPIADPPIIVRSARTSSDITLLENLAALERRKLLTRVFSTESIVS